MSTVVSDGSEKRTARVRKRVPETVTQVGASVETPDSRLQTQQRVEDDCQASSYVYYTANNK
ncbi:hypothetical protein BOTNAR_0491g00050 [Botryotinia narcissicola]|uniref:Uncharacterized protein n=1 Tax=Botryotinia narcissicola TaxID=278944 RepID=A0A4Z1HH37_9HELO|nr:hypothetical protein BOTNAR_0491g00050 [Botryotinia narcissicola]